MAETPETAKLTPGERIATHAVAFRKWALALDATLTSEAVLEFITEAFADADTAEAEAAEKASK